MDKTFTQMVSLYLKWFCDPNSSCGFWSNAKGRDENLENINGNFYAPVLVWPEIVETSAIEKTSSLAQKSANKHGVFHIGQQNDNWR